ncbi:phage portal protein [Lysinibacillus sp. RS5]|uniref:phage portal protein n=1 Tax=unclassified Lysinibacillus TaxID=2636778 RepID=UPI0035BE83AB
MGLIKEWREWRDYRHIQEFRESGMDELLLQAGLASAVLTKEEALSIPSVGTCVDLISGLIATLPIKLYRENSGKIEEMEEDRRVILLNDETQDTLDGFQFKKALVTDYLLEGAGYAYINRRRNDIESLHYVENRNVSVLVGVDPIFKSYDISVNGVNYREFEFIKIARNSKDGVTGNGIIKDHNKILSVAYNTLVFEDSLVKTGGNKKGFLKSLGRLSKDAISELKTAWNNLYKNNTENIVVLNNGLDFKEASSTSVEMQLNENKKTNSSEINKLFKVPDSILDGSASEAVHGNFIKNCILPIIRAIETALNKDLLLPSEKEQSFYFAFDMKELIKGDIEKRFKAYEIAVKNGWMQVDEVRYSEDLPPLGLDFIKLGLQDVLYDPKTKQIYTPNTNKTADISEPGQALEGGEENED